ncbi:MAG: Spy/CpxP family protein refolding chaperone [Burkholderiales bacterium]|nr:Spy/CpxP family protein refolding chaperone [Burkholderiales bacterium]
MKYIDILLVTSVLSLFAGNALAADAPPPPKKPVPARHMANPGYERGIMGDAHGMMGEGHGMMDGGYGAGMMGEGGIKMLGQRTVIVWSLDLSEEQRARITKLIDKLQHDNWAAMGAIMDDSGTLRDLYHADRRDPVAIDKTYQKIFDMKRQMIKSALDTENGIEDILTPDQLKQLKDRLHQSPPRYPGQ